MSWDHYIPVLWESALLSSLKKAHVQLSLTNSNIQVTSGRSVKITSVDDVTIGTYTKGTDISFQTPQDSEQTFTMDQQKYFALTIDSIDQWQMIDFNAARAELMKNSAYGLMDVVDQFIAAKWGDAGIKEGAGEQALGTVASPIEITADGGGTSIKSSVWLSRLNRRMDDGNIQFEDRKVVVPPWLMQKLTLEKLTGFNDVSNEETFNRGRVVNYLGMDILMSNNVVSTSSKYRVMADVPSAISYYNQIEDMQAGTHEKQFGDYIRGLLVYGAKVTRADSLATSILTEGAEGQ